jgi:hypothetical protein
MEKRNREQTGLSVIKSKKLIAPTAMAILVGTFVAVNVSTTVATDATRSKAPGARATTLSIGMSEAQAQSSRIIRRDFPSTRRTYWYFPGNWTRDEAFAVANRLARQYQGQNGYPVVFNSMQEFRGVMAGLYWPACQYAWTGHFQDPRGREPGGGWRTINGESSAPLSELFNSAGPDDGITNEWQIIDDGDGGYDISYGPNDGKNEDGAVVWHDRDGLLEDISERHRGGLIVEVPW